MRTLHHPPAMVTLLCAALASSVGGCSLNGSGALATRISHGDGALVYTSYAPGLSLRTRADEKGASVGLAVRTCIAALDAQSPPAGLYLLSSPRYPARCFARHLTTWGGELRVSPPDLSVGVGFRESAQLVSVAMGDTLDYTIDYVAATPSATHLEVHAR